MNALAALPGRGTYARPDPRGPCPELAPLRAWLPPGFKGWLPPGFKGWLPPVMLLLAASMPAAARFRGAALPIRDAAASPTDAAAVVMLAGRPAAAAAEVEAAAAA